MVSGIILAGGKNSRMHGMDKAFLEINGHTIIERILEIFKELFEEIRIITDNPGRYRFLKEKNVFVASDLINNKGPLAGIYTGLKHMKNEAGFFVACDMPYLHIDLIKRQLRLFQKKRYECLVPVHEGYIEPLHGVYTKPLAKRIYSFIKEKRSSNCRSAGVNEFLKVSNCGFIEARGEEIVSFSNLNTIDDYVRTCAIAGSKGRGNLSILNV